MNRDEIMNMQPWRDLDEAVAIHVMGKENNKTMWGQKVFIPSTDISAAWEVVEKMRTTHKQYITIIDNPHLNYDVRFSGNKSSEYERLSSLPHAICRAALLSLIQEDTP